MESQVKKLPTLEELTTQTSWNRKYREMLEILHHSDDARELITKALTSISKTKDLSYGERKMLDVAKNYKEYLAERAKKVIELAKYRTKRELQ